MTKLEVKVDARTFEIEVDALPVADRPMTVRVNGETVVVRVPPSPDGGSTPEWVVIDDRPYEFTYQRDAKTVQVHGQTHHVQVHDIATTLARPQSGDGRVRAPIPGIITQVLVEPASKIQAGQTLFVLEAMKMENQIRAPRAGVLASLNVQPGRGVMLGEVLAEIT